MKLKHLFASTLVVAAIVSCGKDDKDELTQHLTHRNLMSTWEAECSDFKLFDVSTRSYYVFDGNDFKEVYELYSDDACVSPVAHVAYEGTANIGNEVSKDSSVYDIDYHYKDVKLKAYNADGAKLVEGFCGIEKMPVGDSVSVVNESGKVKCPTKRVPRAEYGIFTVQDGVLHFGEESTLGGRPEDSSERTRTIDPKSSYHKVDKDFD